MFSETRLVDGSPAPALKHEFTKQPYRSKLSGVAACNVVALHPTLALGNLRHILRLRIADPVAG